MSFVHETDPFFTKKGPFGEQIYHYGLEGAWYLKIMILNF